MTKLKFLRLEQGKDQTQLEKDTGVKRWKISLAETGRFKLSEKDYEALSKFFKTKNILDEVELKNP